MADRIFHYPSPSGTVGLYAVFRARSDGDVWNGTANVPFVDGSITAYDVPLAYVGGDAYALTVPPTLPTGETYVVAVYKPATAVSDPTTTDLKLPDEWEFAWNGTSTTPAPGPGDADWTYANEQDVVDLLGEAGLRIISNVGDSDAVTDSARIQRMGQRADALMNGWLRGMGYTVPLVGTDADALELMEEASVKIVAMKLNEARMLKASPSSNRTTSPLDVVMRQYGSDVKSLFRGIRLGSIGFTATKDYAATSKIAIAGGPSDETVSTCVPVYWW